MIVRKHGIFGDYIFVDKKSPPPNDELKEALTEIADYNVLWRKYVSTISGKWGGILTKKDFSKWLQKQIKEASSGN